MSKIKVMSFNLRYDNERDGLNSFSNRFDRVLEVICKESPDIIGFQEVLPSMRDKLRASLTDYCMVSCGRGKNLDGESMLIGFKADRVEMISCESYWLSLTPTIPGSRYGGDQSGCPRMYTSRLLKHRDIEKQFRFINTHLDHEGENARYLGSVQLVQAISQYNEKFVLTGDFNALPDTKEIKLITSALAYRGAIDCSKELEPTFHEFGVRTGDKRIKIDYIFTDGKSKAFAGRGSIAGK